MRKQSGMRYPLDCASTMFLLGRTEKRRYAICFAATLKEPIDEGILPAALESTAGQYPLFFIRFVASGNQLAFEPCEPAVVPKGQHLDMLLPGSRQCEARVTYEENRLYLEYFHAVSDGSGGLTVFLHLLAEYLARKYGESKMLRGFPPVPLHLQAENGYRAFGKGFYVEKQRGAAYRIVGTPIEQEILSSYRFSVREAKRQAKQCQASINEWMAALLCLAIAQVQQEARPGGKPEKIRLTIPVNLRARFPSYTMRNFALNVYPEIQPGAGPLEFSGVCRKIRRYMKRATAPEQLAGRCASSTLACDIWPVRMAPPAVKTWLVRRGLENPRAGSCLTFSNMGAVQLPPEMEGEIASLAFTFSTKPGSPYTCSLISLGDQMRLCIARAIAEPILETQLENLLEKFAIAYEKREGIPGY